METPEAAKARTLAKIEKSGLPKPSGIVDSGNGIQLLWRLTEPADIAVEAVNRALAREFAGDDATFNIDRILRLPGTINLPNKKKLKAGRIACVSSVVWTNENSYPLSAFPRVDTQEAKAEGIVDDEMLSGALPPVSFDGIPDDLQKQITKPDYRHWQGDRSKGMWWAIHRLLDLEIPRLRILTMLLDPKCKLLSEHILDKPNNQRAYAAKQLSDAIANHNAQKTNLEIMLRDHAIILVANKTRVTDWVPRHLYPGDNAKMLRLVSAGDFHLFHANKSTWVKDEPKPVSTSKIFVKLAKRYRGLVVAPGFPEDVAGHLNMWQGFGVEAKTGDCHLVLSHIKEILADDDETSYVYIIKWLAWTVQNPGSPAEVVLVLRGLKGTGKGVILRLMVHIFGAHGMHISSRAHLVGKFNVHMAHTGFLFADEAYWPGDKTCEGALKRMITEPTLMVEPKGIDPFLVTNLLKIAMSSNEDWVVPALGSDERRFGVFDVSDKYAVDSKEKRDYFKALYAEIKNGGDAAFLHYLLNYDLNDWHPRLDIPDTAGLRAQKRLSLPLLDSLVFEFVNAGWLPFASSKHRNRTMTNGLEEGTGFWHYISKAHSKLWHHVVRPISKPN